MPSVAAGSPVPLAARVRAAWLSERTHALKIRIKEAGRRNHSGWGSLSGHFPREREEGKEGRKRNQTDPILAHAHTTITPKHNKNNQRELLGQKYPVLSWGGGLYFSLGREVFKQH